MSVETREFKTEIKQLLDLMIHSLYSHKEVFLRELISNASDAIDRARYESLTNADIQENDKEWEIRITADKEKKTLTVSDNGIGMTKDEIVEALGTIARSGTKEFLQLLQSKEVKDNPELIGQFGVGFYSSFMVADKITVLSRKAGSKDHAGAKWESTGDGTFTVEDIEKKGKGTDVILHLRDDEKQYLEEWEIRDVVRRYSDFIEHPIVMEVERQEQSALDKSKTVQIKKDETLNSRKALWLRDKSEITAEEYNQFYKHVSHDVEEPLKIIHYKAEGTSEFTALLYIPSRLPFNIFYKDYKIGPMLYVKRVQIMEHCEQLLPPYLRFVKGVVDSSDLPLNVSREILQNNRQVEIIKNSIAKKVFDTLGEIKKEEYEKYLKFYKEFGNVLKEGLYYDFLKRENIADLLLFSSTKADKDKFRTFQEYVEDMKEGQEHIYYLPARSWEEAIKSPYLEAFRAKDFEVLIMLDEVDDLVMNGFTYKDKQVKSIIAGDVELDKSEKAEKEKAQKKYQKLINLIKEQLKDQVKDVRLSGRLKDSACLLVADEGDLNPQMEKILKAMGQNVPDNKKILEINPDHPLFAAMNGLFEKDSKSPVLEEYVGLLYDQALLLEGSRPKDPAAFAQILAKLMVESLKAGS
ncbi:MAG: Chaperone protein HtpG [Syntrophorhabdaceae bacterium PtaU1.Bin034]|nr:MAG: Chaperone protein HtpG [Syntrophorhabdaceae bacterium PtaU1.Bin034]